MKSSENPILRNGSTSMELLAHKGKYALVKRLNISPFAQPFVVAVDIVITGDSCEWGQGRYFNDEVAAWEVYRDYARGNTRAYYDWMDRRDAKTNPN